jgi:hypothetical protein
MFAPVYPHDNIKKLYDGVYVLYGSIKMGPGMRMSRNMVILKEGEKLTLINPVRMSEAGLASLDKLGRVQKVIRLGDFHGLDDAFYLNRYSCEFWAQQGQSTYEYPIPSKEINFKTEGPIKGSQFFIFENAIFPEAALLIKNHGLLITTDSIQYYKDWRYFSWFTKNVFKLLGFKMGINIGGPWLKRVTPKGTTLKSDFDQLLTFDFDSMIAAHGTHLTSNAKEMIKIEMEHVFTN